MNVLEAARTGWRPRTVIAAVAVVLLIAVITAPLVATLAGQTERPPPAATSTSPQPTTAPTAAPAPAVPRRPLLFLNADTWVSWHLVDVDDGIETSGGEPGQSITASVIKVGIAADFLSGLDTAHRDPTPHEADLLTRMIRDSNNAAASALYRARGGRAIIGRLVQACNLTSTTAASSWGATRTTSRDLATLGACIADGRVASPGWVAWLLEQMRNIHGAGRFGIITHRPTDRGRPLAIKNGWLLEDGRWHVNCLAIADWWTLAAMVRYPAGYGLAYGADVCAQLAAAAPDDEKAPATAV